MTLLEARPRPYGLSQRSYEKVAHHKKFLEFDFGASIFKKNWQILKKITTPLVVRACETPSVGIDPKSIIRSHIMVWLIMLSKMV